MSHWISINNWERTKIFNGDVLKQAEIFLDVSIPYSLKRHNMRIQ